MPEKPRHRSGYSAEELEQVKSACLTMAVTLGAYLDDVCIVGGLVPALLIDTIRTGTADDERHPGTNDLDIGLALAVLDDERYAEISARLRAEGFEPDVNDAGNRTVQRWRLGERKVTVDFLMARSPSVGRPRSSCSTFGDRGEPKDACDLIYVIRHTPGRGPVIAERLSRHAEAQRPIVAGARPARS